MSDPTGSYEVEFPAGGTMTLLDDQEVELFERSKNRYIEDYALQKTNDLVLVGAILTQQIVMFRAQKRISEMSRKEETKVGDLSAAQAIVTKCAEEIRHLEKALGIDKKTRESGGQHTVANYIERLKRAAHEYGVHIHERVKAYEEVMMEARWKIRLLRNGDEEDQRYHNVSEKEIIDWLERELEKIEQQDKVWAKDKGRLFVGKL